MSEKRFYVDGSYVLDRYTHLGSDLFDCCDLLNALAEKNKEQADTIKHLEEYCGDLEYDNKTLQKQLDKIPKNIRKVWLK